MIIKEVIIAEKINITRVAMLQPSYSAWITKEGVLLCKNTIIGMPTYIFSVISRT